MSTHSFLSRLPLRAARWSATHPWRAIGAWLVFVVAATSLAFVVQLQQTTDADYRIGDSGRADAMIAAGHLTAGQVETILITSAGGGSLDRQEAGAAARQIRDSVAAQAGVTDVATPQVNPRGTALLLDVHLRDSVDDVTALEAVTSRVAAAHPGLDVREAGDVSVNTAINDRVAQDLHSAEGISLPITLLLMLLAFGALIAAGVPVLLALTSVAATMGVVAPLSHLIHSEPTVSSMIVLIGMAVGVDYSLFYVKREREERARGRSTLDAVEIAAATSGHSIMVSGGAVIASMAGLFLVGGATFDSLASGAIIVVAVAVIGSVTVLPAMLVKLGRWADRPRVPLLWRLNRRIGAGGVSRRILAPVVRRPAAALVVSLLALLALAAPALGMKINDASLQTLPQSIPQVKTLNDLAEAFPSQGSTATVVVQAQSGVYPQVIDALHRLGRTSVASGVFESPAPDAIRTSADGATTTLTLPIPYPAADSRSGDAIQLLRDRLAPQALAGLDAEHAVGGDVAASVDYASHQRDRLPLVIGFVLLLTLLIMVAAFRSVAVALLSTGFTLVSVGVAFGILTLVFQHGFGSGALGFTTPGYVIDWIPLFVMVILVGLSMDYNVFVLARIREHAAGGMPARLAVQRGITDTAGVITSAAAVMVSVFSVFVTLSLLEMKMMGVALAASILIDATVIRLVMLPAALLLLGERAWWPGRLLRPRGDVVVAQPTPEPAPEPSRVG